jgi:DNA-binding transcriptional LysR family regulator
MNNLLRKLDLTSLRLFVAVCQEKNIARAAEREFIAPSSVSRRIAEIEAAIGLPVIERQSRGIAVTPAGNTVLRYAEAVLSNIEALGAELSQHFIGVKGKIRVVANLSSIVQFLPEDIAAFQRIYPDVAIDIEEQNSEEVLRTLDERGADFGICNDIPGTAQFEQLPYRSDNLALVVPDDHHLAARDAVSFQEVLQEPFVGLRNASALTQRLAAEATGYGAELGVKIRVSSLDALCRMVHAGLGVAIVPTQVGELYAHALRLKLIPLSDTWAARRILVVFKNREQLTASASTLVGFLTQQG